MIFDGKEKYFPAPQTVSWSLLVTVLLLTLAVTAAELALAQMTHCISLLVLVHQVPAQPPHLCTCVCHRTSTTC